MNWESFRKQLRRELREYSADFRNIGDALQRIEGWITLALILAVIAMSVVWFITGLGFDRLNSMAGAFNVWRPRLCKPLDDIPAMIIVLDAMVMGLLAVVSLGEMMRLLDRVNKGLPAQPRQVAWPAALLLVVCVAGIVYMRAIC
ncbi:MAG TPA: hypothetical protein VFW68_07100 [Rhodocyclaceae bacterium]|nr:hypothetical protein [Rhodocyclaceae bacterium]